MGPVLTGHTISTTKNAFPGRFPTRHVTVGAGGDVAGGAAAGLGGHATRHRVQHQDDGVDQRWVGAD